MTRVNVAANRDMPCEAAQAAWHDRCDGALPERATELRAHLAGCAACRAYAAQMEAICGGLAELSAASAVTMEAEQRERGSVAAPEAPGRSPHRLLLRIGLAMTSAAAVVLVWWSAESGILDRSNAVRVSEIAATRVEPEVASREVAVVEMAGESADRFVPIEQRTTVPAVHLFRVLPVIDAAATAGGDSAAS